MNPILWIASFFWDPNRIAFTAPIINHPIYWYGILFVTGFLLGYFVIQPIFIRFLNQSKHISELDIPSWPNFLQNIQESSEPLIQNLRAYLNDSDKSKTELQESVAEYSKKEFQSKILKHINHFLEERSITRQELQQNLNSDSLLPTEQPAQFLVERLCWFAILGTIIGARLGEIFFYNWPYYSQHPLEMIKIWNGGLASHGGVVGVVVFLLFYLKYVKKWIPQLTFLRLLDFVAIPSALVAVFIRLGNFINQEIIGTPTDMPWGVIFGHPENNSKPISRHPVQLYEAFAYLVTFFILWNVWKTEKESTKPGGIVGLLFILIFGSRFILEFWKSFQPSSLETPYFQMGQLLSIPFVLAGLFLWIRSRKS